MKCTNLYSNKEYEVEIANDLIKSYFPEALFTINTGEYTYILDKVVKKIQQGHQIFCYKLDGVIYTGFYTTHMNKLRPRLQVVKRQLSLF